MQMGFIDSYESDGERFYYFAIDSLTDFLIVRSLFVDIRGKEYYQQVQIIKTKTDTLYIEEALIIAIFDNFSPDYKKIKNILNDTGLIERFNLKMLTKIHFKKMKLKTFKKILN